jgi:hypothetical protein
MTFAEALFQGAENFVATRQGIEAFFVLDDASTHNRKPLFIPLDPTEVSPEWKTVTLVETEPERAENFTGLLESNPDVLTGEIPAQRAFVVQQYFFNQMPTIDDRIIIKASGENFSIAGVDVVGEIGASASVYRLLCRSLN